MIVKYVGPHTGGLQQVGTYQVRINWGTATELPDELAALLLDQAPAHWETVKPKKSTSKKSAATSADDASGGDE